MIIETRQNRQFSMRLTFVVIYSFIFKRFFLFVRFDATGNLLLLFIVIVFPFFFAPFVFGWYSNLIKSHSTTSLVLSCINPRILPISWQSQLGRWCIFQKLFFCFALDMNENICFEFPQLFCFHFFVCVWRWWLWCWTALHWDGLGKRCWFCTQIRRYTHLKSIFNEETLFVWLWFVDVSFR